MAGDDDDGLDGVLNKDSFILLTEFIAECGPEGCFVSGDADGDGGCGVHGGGGEAVRQLRGSIFGSFE